VCDPLTGWTNIRQYDKSVFEYLTAAHQCPMLLSSGTVSEASLSRICENICVQREDVVVLQMSADRPNIYQQLRVCDKSLSIG
jgi:superfamily II DNA helicase RecQ